MIFFGWWKRQGTTLLHKQQCLCACVCLKFVWAYEKPISWTVIRSENIVEKLKVQFENPLPKPPGPSLGMQHYFNHPIKCGKFHKQLWMRMGLTMKWDLVSWRGNWLKVSRRWLGTWRGGWQGILRLFQFVPSLTQRFCKMFINWTCHRHWRRTHSLVILAEAPSKMFLNKWVYTSSLCDFSSVRARRTEEFCRIIKWWCMHKIYWLS